MIIDRGLGYLLGESVEAGIDFLLICHVAVDSKVPELPLSDGECCVFR